MTGDRWDSWPSRASQEYFQQTMEAHTRVREVTEVSPSRWDLTLDNGAVVEVFITDVYTFSVADYALLREKYPDVEIIAQGSSWNNFSTQAAEKAAAQGIRTVYLGGELMSALHGFAKKRAARG